MSRFLLPILMLFSGLLHGAGEIAFIEFQTDNPDQFAFLVLEDIGSNAVIKFTDNGWNDNNTFRSNEGILTWTAPAGGVSAGTIVRYDGSVNIGSFSISGGFAFATGGDQILAYTGSDASPTFLAALNLEGNEVWQADATSSNDSALPSGLTNGTNAVALNEMDNAVYNGITTGTVSEIRTAINNPSNWNLSNTSITSFNGMFFFVTTPVELTNFNAIQKENGVELTWETASELDNAFFAIEKSFNGITFDQIGRVKGFGTTSIPQYYAFLDVQPVSGNNYYRLRQVDFDGDEEIHRTLVVNYDGQAADQLMVFPTAALETINIKFNNTTGEDLPVQIFNTNGQLIRTTILSVGAISTALDVSGLASGQYVVKAGAQVARFIKE